MKDTSRSSYRSIEDDYQKKQRLEYVDQFYVMNPQEEDLLFDGRHLRNGMKVLVEPDDMRVSLTAITLTEAGRIAKQLFNRWCLVTELKVDNNTVSFIGKYDDGNKKKIVLSVEHAWYVKKEFPFYTKEEDA